MEYFNKTSPPLPFSPPYPLRSQGGYGAAFLPALYFQPLLTSESGTTHSPLLADPESGNGWRTNGFFFCRSFFLSTAKVSENPLQLWAGPLYLNVFTPLNIAEEIELIFNPICSLPVKLPFGGRHVMFDHNYIQFIVI